MREIGEKLCNIVRYFAIKKVQRGSSHSKNRAETGLEGYGRWVGF